MAEGIVKKHHAMRWLNMENEGKQPIISIKVQIAVVEKHKGKAAEITTTFYKKLYDTKVVNPWNIIEKNITNVGWEDTEEKDDEVVIQEGEWWRQSFDKKGNRRSSDQNDIKHS